MIPTNKIGAMFTLPENHTPVAILCGGTDADHFERHFKDVDDMEEVAYKDMDAHTSQSKLPLHPVLIMIVAGKDGHLHSFMNLPLQKWEMGMLVPDEVEDSKNIQRNVDWIAGFMHMFCFNDSISAVDLTNGKNLFGAKARFSIDTAIQTTVPRSEVRLESIGTVDDILNGQLSGKEIETAFEVASLAPEVAPPPEIPAPAEIVQEVQDEQNKAEKMRQDQKEVFDKYGWDALVEMCSRMKTPILIEKDHA